MNAQWRAGAWGGVDVIYPFPLVGPSTPLAHDSMAYWSSPNRTDAFGLHLKLGYSQKAWAYLSADLGHIHLEQGNHSGDIQPTDSDPIAGNPMLDFDYSSLQFFVRWVNVLCMNESCTGG